MAVTLTDEFRHKAICRGGELWFAADDAVAIIELAQKRSVPLLGFDAAYLAENETKPSLADGWDYTSSAYPEVAVAHAHAAAFIKSRTASGLLFAVVLKT